MHKMIEGFKGNKYNRLKGNREYGLEMGAGCRIKGGGLGESH